MSEPRTEAKPPNPLSQLSLAQIKELRRQRGTQRRRALPPLVPQERGAVAPLTYSQEQLWFLDQLGLVGAAYNMSTAVRLKGALRTDVLLLALRELRKRHESLRTRFVSENGVPQQTVDPPGAFDMSQIDLRGITDEEAREESLNARMHFARAHRFDLSKGPLLRAELVQLGEEEHALLLTVHHIVCDGWSLGILSQELSALYAASAGQQPSPLAPLPLQYADYAVWQRQWLQGDALQEDLQYWKARLLGAPPQLDLPTDHPRPPMESFRGGELGFELPAAHHAAIRQLARSEGATLFMVILATFQVLLSRWSGQQDIVVGAPVAGRRNHEVEGLIGLFVNMLILRSEIDPSLSFRELVRQVKENTLAAQAHQDLPFELLVKELRPERDLARQPVFQVVLAVQNYPDRELQLPGVTWSSTGVERKATHFDLTLHIYEHEDHLSGFLEYATDLFDAATMTRMSRHFRTLLDGILANPDCALRELPLISQEERLQLDQWNRTEVQFERACVHELFSAQVRATPEAIAVVHGSQRMTYAELDAISGRLASALIQRGVRDDDVVGICVDRGISMMVGLLAILKAGAAYLPIDPNYPVERVQYMLEDASPRLILTQARLQSLLVATEAAIIDIDSMIEQLGSGAEPAVLTSPRGSVTGLVYVIYTSGSTGRPKGTAMEHHSMANLIAWHRATFGSGTGCNVLQFAALSFDVAFQETFTTLCTGGTLVLLDEWVRRDAHALSDLLARENIHRLFLPPLMLQGLAEHFASPGSAPPESLQDVITAGEQLRITPEIVRFFQRQPGCRLHNHYGPTETHVVTALSLSGEARNWPAVPSIGVPIANSKIHILDADRQPVPIGVVGEVYIAGEGVARGYRGRPELTSQRFLRDPFSADARARMYRTGDLARWRPNGVIEYLGRNDDQVKIRGFRIELGEIESQLAQHPSVNDVAVLAREDTPGDKRLVAYVILSEAGQAQPDCIDGLRLHLKSRLPEHMVPSAIVVLSSFPLTPSGKLNRRALPAPDPTSYVVRDYQPAQGEVETALASIWQELLRIDRIGRADNFFELGGYSLLGIRLIARVEAVFQVRISAIAVFQHPTIEQMARLVENLRAPPVIAATTELEEGVI